MSKFKIINLIDKLFVTCAVFLIIYGWINFYIRNLWSTFVLSLVFSFACLFVLNYFIDKKQKKTCLNKKNIEEINTYFLAFNLLCKKEKLEILNKILETSNKVIKTDDGLIYFKENKKILLLLATEYELIDNKNLITIISNCSNIEVDEIEIVCNEVSPGTNYEIFKNKKIHFTTKSKLYNDYFLKFKTFPDSSNINLQKLKPKFSDIVKNFFTPNKAKGYFFCGLILIFSSIILPYHFYYIVVGSTLLLFSIICKILPLIK